MKEKKDFKFEVFEEAPRHRSDSQLATLTRAGNIYLNKKFRDAHWEEIEGFHIVFEYDRESRVICLQTVVETVPNSYPIREMADGKGLVVSSRAFLKHFGIPFKESSSYEIQYSCGQAEDDKCPYILIDLKKKI